MAVEINLIDDGKHGALTAPGFEIAQLLRFALGPDFNTTVRKISNRPSQSQCSRCDLCRGAVTDALNFSADEQMPAFLHFDLRECYAHCISSMRQLLSNTLANYRLFRTLTV